MRHLLPDSRRAFTLAAPLVLLLPLAGCAHLAGALAGKPTPKISVRGVAVTSFGLRRLSLRVDLTVQNPYSVALPVLGLRYRIWVTGRELGRGSIQMDRTVPPHGSAPASTVVAFRALDIARIVMRLARGRRDYRIALRLTARTPFGDIEVPVDHSGTLGGKEVRGVGKSLGLGRGLF